MLKIYADENIERAVIDGLKRRNIDISSANDENKLWLKGFSTIRIRS